MGVYMASMAKDVAGKMVAIWFPISAFVTLGLEHSVANMFIIPLGIFSGAAVSWKTFFMANLLPVTLGNIVGGAVVPCLCFPPLRRFFLLPLPRDILDGLPRDPLSNL